MPHTFFSDDKQLRAEISEREYHDRITERQSSITRAEFPSSVAEGLQIKQPFQTWPDAYILLSKMTGTDAP